MKYTSLLCAAVAAAALGSFAADGTRTPVVEEPFDAAPTGAMTGVYASIQTSHWTVNELDESAIIEGSITATEAVDGYTGKSLLLNTQGQELSVAAAAQDAKSEIKMKIRLVASDTAPTIDANDVHAAVYLLEQNPDGPTAGDGLYAWSYNPTTEVNEWVALSGTGFEVANGSLIALKVVMDYDNTTATYSAFNLGDDPDQEVDDEDYIELDTVDMANALNNQVGHLQSVAFKGTGSVDDLFITSVQQIATSATIVFDMYVDGVFEDNLVPTDTIDNVADFSVNFEDPDAETFGEGYVIVSVDVWKDGATTDQDTLVASLDPADLLDSDSGDFFITDEAIAPAVLEAGASYTVKVMVGPSVSPSTYVGPKSGSVQILCAADETAYGQGFVPLKFTSIEFVEASGNVSIVATFDATVVFDNDATTGTADFGVITTSALTGATTVLTGSVNATAAGGTVTIPMPAGDALFLKGFTTAPAPAGD